AAAHLGISQPALTLSIRRLEEILGLALFIRTTRQVTLTAAGREFVLMAERVLNDLSRGMRSLQELSDRHRGHVTVTSLITLRMSAVVAEYNKRFPGGEIELREGFEDDVKEDVRVADFGLGYIGELPSSHTIEGLSIETLRVVLRRDHSLADARQVAFEELKDTALVSLPTRSRARRLIDAAATSAGFALRHAVTVGLPLTLFNLVSSGAGVAVVPGGPPPLPAFKHLVSRALVKPSLSSEVGIMPPR